MKTDVVKGGGGISSGNADERKGTDGLGGGGAGNASGGSGVVIIRYSCPRGMYLIFR